jgi:lauroyl/myristoyl acyltransferase
MTTRIAELETARNRSTAPQEQGQGGEGGKGAKFRREERREYRYPLSVFCAVIVSWLTRLTPAAWRYRIADKSGDLFYRTSPVYRENVRANVSQVLGPAATVKEIDDATRGVFRTSSRNFTDLLLVPHKAEGQMSRETIVTRGSFRLIDDALADGKGAIILTGHLGAFDLMGQVLHERGYKLTVVTARTTGRFLFDAVTYLRHARGMELVEASPSGVRRAIQAVRRGECAVLVSDRDFLQSGRPITFFGRETTLPPGVVRIAREAGATIVPVFGERVPSGHSISVEPGFKVPKTDDIEADVAYGLERVARVLERAISLSPDQWVMFQRVWPSEPAGQVRAAQVDSRPLPAVS